MAVEHGVVDKYVNERFPERIKHTIARVKEGADHLSRLSARVDDRVDKAIKGNNYRGGQTYDDTCKL